MNRKLTGQCLLLGVTSLAMAQEIQIKSWVAPPHWQAPPQAAELAGSFADKDNSRAANSAPLALVAMTPCRLVDTRLANGPLGGPMIAAGETRTLPFPSGGCGLPADTQAYSLNVTVVPPGPLGYLTLWPAGQTRPLVSTLNAYDGRVDANAAVIQAGTQGAVSVYVTHATHLIVDVNGYYVPSPAQQSAAGINRNLAFNLNPGSSASPIAPHPFESDPGWGGGARPAQLTDGYRACDDPSGWACGLAFSGGTFGGGSCGVRQSTIHLGATPVQVSAVRITHHGLEHVPKSYRIQTWSTATSSWVDRVTRTANSAGRCVNGASYDPVVGPAGGWACTLTDEFPPVQTTKVRYVFNNCEQNVLSQPNSHGWLYEFEVYSLPW